MKRNLEGGTTMRREKWNKYGLSAVVTLAVLVVIYMIQLNFGDYLAQIWDAFKSVAIPAALALFVSYLIRPMYRGMYKKGLNKTIATLLSMLVFAIVVGGFITLIVVLISTQVNEIIGTGWSIVEVNLDWLFNMMPPEMVAGITNDLGQLDVSKAFEYLTSTGEIIVWPDIFTATVNSVVGLIYWLIVIIMMPVFLFFFLREGDTIMKSIIRAIPKKFHRDDFDIMFQLAHTSTEKYMRGKIISIGFLTVFFSISFTVALLFFTPITIGSAILYGLLFGMIISILDLIPYIGPGIGILLPLLYILIAATTTTEFLVFGLIFIAIDILGQNLQKIIIEPMVMSKEIEIHPLTIFSGLLFFGALFGFVGLIIATPIVATFRSIYRYLMGKYSDEAIETIIEQDVDGDGDIGE
jgi:putative permease